MVGSSTSKLKMKRGNFSLVAIWKARSFIDLSRRSIQVKDLPDPTDTHVGNRVRMRRLMLGMSQAELADAIGVTFQQVQKYEKGMNRVSASRLQQVAQVLQVPIPFFFEGLPAPKNTSKQITGAPSPAYAFDLLATSDGLSLVKFFTQIEDPTLRRRVVHLVEAIAGDGN
jgi:transcriptional regulator with XRE-family HTH domain